MDLPYWIPTACPRGLSPRLVPTQVGKVGKAGIRGDDKTSGTALSLIPPSHYLIICSWCLRALVVFFHYSNICTNKPSLSFGSNQVDFGGMILPASAIVMSSSRDVG